jgi:hypothetical protein
MIEVNYYNNGVSIKGHSAQDVCSEVSVPMYYLYSDIHFLDVDYIYYTSDVHAPTHMEQKTEGVTYIEFDNTDDKVMYLYENYKRNTNDWNSYNNPKEVKITNIDENIVIPTMYLDRERTYHENEREN